MPTGRFGPRENKSSSSPFGNWLRAKRLQTGITAEELSKMAGVSRATIATWEFGHAEPSKVTKYGLVYIWEHLDQFRNGAMKDLE